MSSRDASMGQGQSSRYSATPQPPQIDGTEAQQAVQDGNGWAVGIYNPQTGQTVIGPFGPNDFGGHDDLIHAHGFIPGEFQGFVIGPHGQFIPISGLNPPWTGGAVTLPPESQQVLQQTLRALGLVH